jgi:hypothetical protein
LQSNQFTELLSGRFLCVLPISRVFSGTRIDSVGLLVVVLARVCIEKRDYSANDIEYEYEYEGHDHEPFVAKYCERVLLI